MHGGGCIAGGLESFAITEYLQTGPLNRIWLLDLRRAGIENNINSNTHSIGGRDREDINFISSIEIAPAFRPYPDGLGVGLSHICERPRRRSYASNITFPHNVIGLAPPLIFMDLELVTEGGITPIHEWELRSHRSVF